EEEEQLHLRYLVRGEALVGCPLAILELPAGYQVVPVIRVILQSLQTKEANAEQGRETQKEDQAIASTHLRVVHRQHHRQAADEKHKRIDAADDPVEFFAGFFERLPV